MKAKYMLLLPILLGISFIVLTSKSSGPAASGNGNRTGSPGSNGTCTSCHSGGSFGTSITASVTDLLGNSITAYTPGDSYYVEYQVSSTSGIPKYGFQSVMLTSTNANAGDFDSVLTINTQITTLSGKEYPEQSAKSTSGNFKVRWVAPSTGSGLVTLYYIGNAVNNNSGTSGDEGTLGQSLSLSEILFFTGTSIQDSAVSCSGGSNGVASATVANGTSPYTYAWSNGMSSGSTTATTHVISNLSAGMYYVTVTDGNSDVSIDSVNITEPNPLFSIQSHINETCYQSNDGTASLTITGGTAPYSYNWSSGGMNSQVSKLSSGDHIVTISDVNSCSIVDTVTIDSASQIIINETMTHPNCTNQSTGTISISVSGGVGTFTYLWSSSEMGVMILGKDTGMFSVTVTDASGCSATESYQLSSSNLPPNNQFSVDEPTCYTSLNGSVKTSVSGGLPPYSYAWNTGNLTANLIGVDTGFYKVTITDSFGCMSEDSINLSSSNVVPIVKLDPDTIICDTSLGSFSINAGNLIDDYNYLWNTGDTSYALTISMTGDYSLQVTDSVGCIGMDSILVGEMICVNSVEDLFALNKVSLYPNPSKNHLFLESEVDGDIILYDVFGKEVLTSKIQIGKSQVSLSEIPSGAYFVVIKSRNSVGIQKILVL
jgi:hypothetical protein